MHFHLEFTPKPFEKKISLQEKIFLIGSCFTEQMGHKLSAHKFNIIDNPHGILFNPLSIAKSIDSYLQPYLYTHDDLFFHQEIWGSWDHHTRFSSVDKTLSLEKINASQQLAHRFLKESGWLIITLGSSFVYELADGSFVANCHKVPTDKFTKRMIPTEETVSVFSKMIDSLKQFNPQLHLIFTISPVRHLRDGFIENNRSKARLISAVEQLTAQYTHCHYFPAYELIIDDLRDHRFYADDLVHPNYAATNYVWEKFQPTCIEESSRVLMKELSFLHSARNHKAFNPTSTQHRHFLSVHLEKAKQLQQDHPFLNLQDEIVFFEKALLG